jgi:hypothetical protein
MHSTNICGMRDKLLFSCSSGMFQTKIRSRLGDATSDALVFLRALFQSIYNRDFTTDGSPETWPKNVRQKGRKTMTRCSEGEPNTLGADVGVLAGVAELPRSTLQRYNYPSSLDVTELYTSVPPREAIDNAIARLEEKPSLCRPMKPAHLRDLLEVILSKFGFRYKDEYFMQVRGLPMGNAMSGVLAILFMDTLEKNTLRNLTNIARYKRYVDDTLIITKTTDEAVVICNALNKAHPAIQLEWNYLPMRTPFHFWTSGY